MANTYTQIHIHVIFGVKNRNSLIDNSWKHELYKYITGIIQNNGHKLISINGAADHIHILFGMQPIQSLSDLMQDIKASSSKWINKSNFMKGKFSWQEGYGAFSYSKSQLPKIVNYILQQELHHQKKTFTEEYEEFLKRFCIEYNEKYIFYEVE